MSAAKSMRIDRISIRGLLVSLSRRLPVWERVAAYLLAADGAVVTTDEIADYVWQDDESGGPDDTRGAIHQAIFYLRANGSLIDGHGWRGYRLISYKSIGVKRAHRYPIPPLRRPLRARQLWSGLTASELVNQIITGTGQFARIRAALIHYLDSDSPKNRAA